MLRFVALLSHLLIIATEAMQTELSFDIGLTWDGKPINHTPAKVESQIQYKKITRDHRDPTSGNRLPSALLSQTL